MADDEKHLPKKLNELRQVDSICDKFEAAIMARQEPLIETYLQEAPTGIEAALFAELLSLELAYRLNAGLSIDHRHYLDRFKKHREAVQRALPSKSLTLGGLESDTLASESPTPLSASASGKRIGDYRILEEIARGGMGVVYKANQIRLNRTVALKMILKGQFASKAEVARFYTEAKAIAALEHPAIISIYDVDCLDDNHFYTMNFVEGKSLTKQFKNKTVNEKEAIRIVHEIATAIAYAHSKGVIHRDLKLDNVLIDDNDDIHIIDFGLCKSHHAGDGDTVSGQLLGTPIYMSPEQARGSRRDVGVATDIYAMGMILYRLGTGRFPFESQSIYDLLQQIEEKTPPAPTTFNPALSKEFDRICLHCLEKNPTDRYPTVHALAQDLKTQSTTSHHRSTDKSTTTQTRSLITRPLRAFVILAVLCLIIGLGLAFNTSVWPRFASDQSDAPRDVLNEQPTLLSEQDQKIHGQSFKIKMDQENRFENIAVDSQHPTLIAIDLTIECSEFNFYTPPGNPPPPSNEVVANDPGIIKRNELEEFIRVHFEYEASLLVSDESGDTLSESESRITWDRIENTFLENGTWDEESQTVKTRFRCPLTLINKSDEKAEQINATISIKGDTVFGSKILYCEMQLFTPPGQ